MRVVCVLIWVCVQHFCVTQRWFRTHVDPGNLFQTFAVRARFYSQTNTTLREITINGKLSLVEFRDEMTQELDLSSKGYSNEEAIIIGALLEVCSSCGIALHANVVAHATRLGLL